MTNLRLTSKPMTLAVMQPKLTLTPQQLSEVFPFHFVFNRQQEILQVGQSLLRLYSQPIIGSQFCDRFSIFRPTIPLEFEAICQQTNSLFLLDCLHIPLQLQGQMLYECEADVIFFLGSPRITDITELSQTHLTLQDFALHDPIADFLVLLQTQKMALSDAQKLTAKLKKQRKKLQQDALHKAEQAASAKAQAKELQQALDALRVTQTQLVQNEKMASLGQLVAGIAHEINNPVNFIHGNLNYAQKYFQDLTQLLELYQQHRSDPEIQIYVEAIDLDFLLEDLPQILTSMQTGTERIQNLVRSLKNFARHDEAEFKIVDIHEGIENTLLVLQHRLQNNETETAIEIIREYGKLPSLECYAGQLNQVFLNIINNSIDALQEQSPHSRRYIRITTELSTPDTITIKIADNGSGMPQEIQDRIFDPFFTTKPVGQGTGLGLSISYQIVVKQHQGSLICFSEPGQGTEFQISIPISA